MTSLDWLFQKLYINGYNKKEMEVEIEIKKALLEMAKKCRNDMELPLNNYLENVSKNIDEIIQSLKQSSQEGVHIPFNVYYKLRKEWIEKDEEEKIDTLTTTFNEQTEEVTVGKTIENTYTELQVREAIIKAFDYHQVNGHLPEIAILNIIQSLKQPKKD